jgi:ABC-type transporter Mla subunit MlaD
MSQKRSDILNQIEETQDALRDSIAHSKELAEKTDRLLERHREELQKGAEAQPPVE